jgi:outer membrane beta-barrel protein
MLSTYHGQSMFRRVLTSISLCPLIFASLCYADVVEFPEEELATESVLPVFDKKSVVRERKIKTEKRFELGGGVGLNLVEPLYEQMVFNLTASYHFDEIHGANLSMYFLRDGLSTAGSDLKAGNGLIDPNTFDASRAPTIESMFFANYQFTAYYGKLSLTKQSTMNLSLYGIAGAGLVNWTDTSTLGLDVGIGQKLYVNKNLGFRLDLMVSMYSGPDPTSPKTAGKQLPAGGAKLDSNQFDSTYYIRPFLTGSVIYLF